MSVDREASPTTSVTEAELIPGGSGNCQNCIQQPERVRMGLLLGCQVASRFENIPGSAASRLTAVNPYIIKMLFSGGVITGAELRADDEPSEKVNLLIHRAVKFINRLLGEGVTTKQGFGKNAIFTTDPTKVTEWCSANGGFIFDMPARDKDPCEDCLINGGVRKSLLDCELFIATTAEMDHRDRSLTERILRSGNNDMSFSKIIPDKEATPTLYERYKKVKRHLRSIAPRIMQPGKKRIDRPVLIQTCQDLRKAYGSLARILRRPASEDWYRRAICKTFVEDLWHSSDRRKIEEAKVVCRNCPVLEDCLNEELTSDEKDSGIRGGFEAWERAGFYQLLARGLLYEEVETEVTIRTSGQS